jgi:signal transduction histidine kinase
MNRQRLPIGEWQKTFARSIRVSPPIAPTPPGAAPKQRSATAKPLRGRSLIVARGAWMVVAVLSLGFFAAGVPSEFAVFGSVCQNVCTGGQLSQAGLHALQNLGLSLDFYAAYAVVLDVAFAAAYAMVAAAIFWRKPADPMALLASFALLTFGTANFPDTMNALAAEHPSLWWPVAFLNFAGAATFGLFLYLFPDGRFVPLWTRWVALAWIAWQLPKYWFPGWAASDLNSWPGWLAVVVWAVALGTVVYAQAYRYRRVSDAARRRQIKWVVFGISAAVLMFLGIATALSAFAPTPTSPGTLRAILIGYAIVYAGMLLIPLSIGVAILRQHLWDIDLIINRALVYGALTASVVLLYVLVVGGLGEILRVRGNLVISLLATGLAAVIFQPLRYRLQHGVNRLMYGERDEPYAVLSRLGSRLESTLAPDAVLPAVAKTVRDTLKLPYVEIQLKREDGFASEAVSGAAAPGEPAGGEVRLPLVYGGETVGRLVLAPRAGESGFTPSERRLLEDLAHQVGASAHSVLMTEEAIRLSADLQRSRERLVEAREEERRRLRRDLHDGLGPRLSSQALTIDAVRALMRRDPDAAEQLLLELKTDAQDAVTDIRRLVYGLRPPALDDLGLLGALRETGEQYVAKGLSVSVEAPKTLPPLSAAVEVACYRIAQEALSNVARHAGADACAVSLVIDERDVLRLEVRDDGIGIADHRADSSVYAGVGLTSMRERATELGGSLVVEPVPEGGTVVRATLPLPEEG